ncbi:hypothetical protein [Ligilactobacillus sp. UO.C109]|uniref:hypothetical protein n=1 Tax=Ligilactobacillus sp. UO.C109 TaxID=3003264 RepID=UPI002285C44E|nr:hypothetical protein [Ligilactobacillus sp. UO.C109]MCZ0743870.1 hypothetical protein [Ligilactobacillus sp. UO.C109]
MKYKLSTQELQEHWDNQIRFIRKSVEEFDLGDEMEAQRIATSLRILFHDTKLSKSLFKQLGLGITFYSSGQFYTPSNLLTSWTLLSMELNPNGVKYKANLESQSRYFMKFHDWWNEIIFDDHKNRFTRKDIVTSIANQDGGAHVDPKLDGTYANLIKMNSLGWSDSSGNAAVNNPAYQAVRVIANEFLVSLELFKQGLKNRRKQKNKKFEMRIVDDVGRRYKWLETGINYSSETFQVVNKDRSEKRTLYIDEYKSGVKVEYIGY